MSTTLRQRIQLPVLAASLAALALLGFGARPTTGQSPGALQSQIQGETQAIEGARGHLNQVRRRLAGLRQSAAIQQGLLDEARADLRASRAHLSSLRRREAHGREVLASQLVAQYENPPPDVVTVVMDAHGFEELLERMERLKRVEHANTRTIEDLHDSQVAVAAEQKHLERVEADRERQQVTILAQRDEIARIEYALAKRQKQHIDRRAGLKKKLAAAQKAFALAQARSIGAGANFLNVAAPSSIPPWSPHGGAYGFFQAPGTNYTYGDEPQIVARLDALGQALHLHLIGISGYRSPAHSVAVGGFPNDPHTRGQASDTLGVEAVPAYTLSKFGLWRPFSAFSERNHIQLLGSSTAL